MNAGDYIPKYFVLLFFVPKDSEDSKSTYVRQDIFDSLVLCVKK